MITQNIISLEPPSWQIALRDAITSPDVLWKELDLDPALLPSAIAAAQTFKLRVPRGFLNRMQRGDLNDPLLKQVLPLGAELVETPGYETDPLREQRFNPAPGLLHKYQGRVLLTFAGSCAVNCRYCFRRHFPYQENNPGRAGWDEALTYIQSNTSIHEIILSGGDPLIVSDAYLAEFIEKAERISHLTTLRFHTRLPIVLPERITSPLCQILKKTRFKTVVVTHANHAQEIDNTVRQSLTDLRGANVTLLNQTVLLKGVNDDAHILANLNQALFNAGVLPYYLHLLDRVQGTSHFDIPETRAHQIHRELRSQLPGYLVPKLVREEPGEASKTWINLSAG